MLRTNLHFRLGSAAVLLFTCASPALWAAEEEAQAPEKPAAAPAVPAEDPVADKAPAVETAPENSPAEVAEIADPPETPASEVLQNFMKHVTGQDGVTDEQKAKVKELVDSLQADPYAQDVIVTLAQRELSPEFSQALEFLAEENLPEAQAALAELAKSKDPYLAAESSFYLARSYIMEDRYEEALPQLQAMGDKWSQHSLHTAEALFLKGVSEVRILKRKEAAASLAAFLKQFPHASERMKIAAFRMLDLLEQS
jgi:TolA-binding protein